MLETSSIPALEAGFNDTQAEREAGRCLLCHDAPCSAACPAGTDPALFIRKLRFANLTGAYRTIKENNILGGICGVLCPVGNLCEKGCLASGIDRPVEIGKLQRYLVEKGQQEGRRVLAPGEPKTKKVAVVGSGPAGLSCAAELAKAGYRVDIYERYPEPGGMLRYGIPLHRFPERIFLGEIRDLMELGVKFICSTPLESPEAISGLLGKGYQAVFAGVGQWQPETLRSDSTPAANRFSSVQFLRMIRENREEELKPWINGKTVGVIGGGSVAIDSAETAFHLGAETVHLIYRRGYNQMPATEAEKQSALKLGINFLVLNQPLDYLRAENGLITGIKIIRTKLGNPDSNGRKTSQAIMGTEWNLEVDTVIEAIGQKTESGSPAWYPKLKINEKGLIEADPATGATSVEGIYAGGDIVRGPALIVEAVADGKKAARAMIEFLKKN